MLATIERFESGGSDGLAPAGFHAGFRQPPAFSRTTRRALPRRGGRGYVHPYTQRAGFDDKADFLDLGDLDPKKLVKNAVDTAASEIKAFYTDGMKKIKEGLKNIFDNLRKEIGDALDNIKTAAKKKFDEMVEDIKAGIEKFKKLAIEEYEKLRDKVETAFTKLKNAAKAELVVVKDKLLEVYSKVKDVAKEQMAAAMDVILEAVRPTVHKYVPPVIAVMGLTAFVAVSDIPPVKMLGALAGSLLSWTIFLLFLYVAYFTWLSTAGPEDKVAKFMGGPDLARRVGFIEGPELLYS